MKIGFLLFNKLQLLDLIAPLEISSFWQELDNTIEICTVAEKAEALSFAYATKITPEFNYANCPNLDYLVIPGGWGRIDEMKNDNTLNFIKAQYKNCKIILSVCTGAFLLAAAGLLEGKAATTYWRTFKEFKTSYPNTSITEERIVKSGKVWTSGGVTSGIDLMLELINEVSGKHIAGQVQFLIEYFPNPKYASTDNVDSLPDYYTNDKYSENHTIPAYILKHILGYS